MADPACPQKAPYAVELPPGEYRWCACGQSRNQPYCDGSHKGGEFAPIKFALTNTEKVWLCGCKRSAKKPFCDGTHKSLS